MLEKMACLHYQLRVYLLDSNSLSILRLLDECASRIPACTVPADFKLQDDTSLLCAIIDMIYTSLLSICVPETPSNSISEIKNLLSLYYRMVIFVNCVYITCDLFFIDAFNQVTTSITRNDFIFSKE